MFSVPRSGLWVIPRYDVLLICALTIQFWMVWTQLEALDELKAITIFHLVGFALEVFKTSSGVGSWSLLVIMTFTFVANLKHIKARVHVPA